MKVWKANTLSHASFFEGDCANGYLVRYISLIENIQNRRHPHIEGVT